jgi:hypothetical protein
MRKKTVEPSSTAWKDFVDLYKDGTIYVDVMGTFFWKIKQFLVNGNKDGLLNYLKSKIQHQNIIAVFDGKQSMQKSETRRKILEASQKQLNKLEKFVAKISKAEDLLYIKEKLRDEGIVIIKFRGKRYNCRV